MKMKICIIKVLKKISLSILTFCCLNTSIHITFGEILPRSISTDNRIKVVNYSENNIIKITGYYGMQTTIQLSKDEKVSTISLGDTTGWQIHSVGSIIFLKPIEFDADTNMTLVTNKRIYFIDLKAEEVNAKNKGEVAYNIRFVYHDEFESNTSINDNTLDLSEPGEDLNHPEKYNYNYLISGDVDIAPMKIFDDGKLTFVQFSNQIKDIPAIFAVDDNLHEHLINFIPSKSKPNLIIVEQVFNKLTLRLGNKVLCVYNEGYANNNHYTDKVTEYYANNNIKMKK